MQEEIEKIKNKYFKIANEIKAPEDLVYFYDEPKDLGYAHVEYEGGEFFYVVTERGIELKRLSTNNPDKILNWLIKDLTFSMACKYELTNKKSENQDSRRVMFRHQVELLESINKDWAEEQKLENEKILQKYPYDDFGSLRAQLTKRLRDEGQNPDVAWKMACERYPEPAGEWNNTPPLMPWSEYKKKHSQDR